MVDSSDFYAASPVPADKFLWADEKPFTSFNKTEGQLDLRVFEQDVWWVDIHGQEHLLNEMSREYLQNVLTHLFTHVDYFYTGSCLRMKIEQVLALLPIFGAPENIEEYAAYVAHKESPLTKAPGKWLMDTPLTKRIVELLDAENAIETID